MTSAAQWADSLDKPPVIADADLRAVVSLLVHEAAKARDEQADVRLGEFVRNDGSPAAGTEMNHLFAPPMITSAWHTLPAGSTGSASAGLPLIRIFLTPFCTLSGFVT